MSCRVITLELNKFIEELLLVEADANPNTHSVFHNNLIFESHLLLLHDVKDEGKNLLQQALVVCGKQNFHS